MSQQIAGFLDYVFSRMLGLRVVPAHEFERMRTLAYRNALHAASTRGDTAYLEREASKHRLSRSVLRRLSRRHTPLESWPEEADLFEPRGDVESKT
jgi:hypothetical protein